MSGQYHLSKGSHDSPAKGRCAMEWVAYLAGEKHTDQPVCVSPVLRGFGISLNDNWEDEQRQKLRPYLARCIGTAGDGRDQERGWLAMDWLIREFTPKFMELVPSLSEHVTALRSLEPVRSNEALDDAMILLRNAQKASAAARAAAGDAAGDAAWDAAGAAAGDAAWDAARAAAWDAAWDAARAAARDAARAAAGDAAWDAARAAAGAAAWDAARDAARAAARAAAGAAARAAARDAARDVLAPTVLALQDSALDLFDRMLPTEIIELPVVEEAEWRAVCAL
jgi:hypothetical protein